SVHIAGTKGKGSTCAMIAAMLESVGYRVGLYTSPHLVDIRERIQIDGHLIPHAELARIIRHIQPIANRMRPMPSYFDVLTAAAFKYFAEQEIDIAVVETGLGGRLDSTNVLKPEITAITSISKDHMAQLGNTLAKIAEEKAGIFKKDIPAITVTQDPEVEPVLRRVAEKVGAPFDVAGKTIEFSYRFDSGAAKVICTKVNNVRVNSPERLAARYVELYGKMAQVAPNLAGALEIANRACTKEELICMTVSLCLVGEAKKLFAAKANGQ